MLWDSSGVQEIQQCPSFKGGANCLVDPFTGYNYNTSVIGHGQFESILEPAKASAIRIPQELLCLAMASILEVRTNSCVRTDL